MAEITQTITEFTGDSPNSATQTQEQFDVSADALAARMSAWPTEYNNFGAQVNSVRTEITSAASTVEAIGTAYQGEWSGLTGAFVQGNSVSHNSRLWIATINIPDITLSEPSLSSTDWMITNDNSIGFRGITTVAPVDGVVTFDVSAAVNFEVTLTPSGLSTAFNFSNLNVPNVLGSSGLIIIRQDATGGRTFTLPIEAKTPVGGAAIVQTTTANTVSTLSYFVASPTSVFVNYIGDFQ